MKRTVLLMLMVLMAVGIAPAQTVVPAGTALKVQLQNTLSTFSNKPGDTFTGRVTEAIMLNGETLMPAGSTLQGRVTKVTEPRRIHGRPTIAILPETITLPTGEKIPMSATLVDTNLRDDSDVNEEGQFKGPSHDRKDLLLLGTGTGGGVLIGAISAGAKGTGIGAGIGAGAALGYWLYKRNTAVLPTGTELTIELDRPLSLSMPTAGQ